MTYSASRIMSAGTEQWRPIPGYEGRYEISDAGRVLSTPRDARPARILRPKVQGGYHYVTLYDFGARAMWRVHRLVLIAFVGPPRPREQGRHLNGDPTDNRLANLAWGLPSENQYDTVAHGTHRNARRTHCKNGHSFADHGVTVNIPSRRQPFRECMVCKREKRKSQPRYKPRPIVAGDGDPRHGTQAGYAHYCRCDPCRLAHNEYKRVSRRRVRDRAMLSATATSVGAAA